MALIRDTLILMSASGQTASTDGTSYQLSPSGVPADAEWGVWFSGVNNSGTPTLDMKVQHSPDGVLWVDLVSATQLTTTDAAEYVEITTDFGPYVRAVSTLGGTTPDYDVTVKLTSTAEIQTV